MHLNRDRLVRWCFALLGCAPRLLRLIGSEQRRSLDGMLKEARGEESADEQDEQQQRRGADRDPRAGPKQRACSSGPFARPLRALASTQHSSQSSRVSQKRQGDGIVLPTLLWMWRKELCAGSRDALLAALCCVVVALVRRVLNAPVGAALCSLAAPRSRKHAPWSVTAEPHERGVPCRRRRFAHRSRHRMSLVDATASVMAGRDKAASLSRAVTHAGCCSLPDCWIV